MIEEISNLAQECVSALKYILLECSVGNIQKKPIIKIVVYNISKPIGSKDCAIVTEILSSRLDILDPFEGNYGLVVESPGLEREIKDYKEYSYFLNKEFKIFPIESSDYFLKDGFFIATLVEINNNILSFIKDKKNIEIKIENIQKAKLHCDFSKILRTNKKEKK